MICNVSRSLKITKNCPISSHRVAGPHIALDYLDRVTHYSPEASPPHHPLTLLPIDPSWAGHQVTIKTSHVTDGTCLPLRGPLSGYTGCFMVGMSKGAVSNTYLSKYQARFCINPMIQRLKGMIFLLI